MSVITTIAPMTAQQGSGDFVVVAAAMAGSVVIGKVVVSGTVTVVVADVGGCPFMILK